MEVLKNPSLKHDMLHTDKKLHRQVFQNDKECKDFGFQPNVMVEKR